MVLNKFTDVTKTSSLLKDIKSRKHLVIFCNPDTKVLLEFTDVKIAGRKLCRVKLKREMYIPIVMRAWYRRFPEIYR